jgi:hypothetical protein
MYIARLACIYLFYSFGKHFNEKIEKGYFLVYIAFFANTECADVETINNWPISLYGHANYYIYMYMYMQYMFFHPLFWFEKS